MKKILFAVVALALLMPALALADGRSSSRGHYRDDGRETRYTYHRSYDYGRTSHYYDYRPSYRVYVPPPVIYNPPVYYSSPIYYPPVYYSASTYCPPVVYTPPVYYYTPTYYYPSSYFSIGYGGCHRGSYFSFRIGW